MARLKGGPLPDTKQVASPRLLRLELFSAPGKLKHVLALGRRSRADLVEGGVGNLVGINLRISVYQIRQDCGHFCVWAAAVGIGAFFVVPQTHAESFGSGRDCSLVVMAKGAFQITVVF